MTHAFLSPFSASTSRKDGWAFMTGLRYSPLHVTELCGEMLGKFKVGRARLTRQRIKSPEDHHMICIGKTKCTSEKGLLDLLRVQAKVLDHWSVNAHLKDWKWKETVLRNTQFSLWCQKKSIDRWRLVTIFFSPRSRHCLTQWSSHGRPQQHKPTFE